MRDTSAPVDESRLTSIRLFSRLSRRQRQKLASHMTAVELAIGEHIVDEGQSAIEFFILERGSAAVVSGGKHLTDLGAGDYLGEIGLIQQRDRTASVIATSPTTALVMPQAAFEAMARSMPAVAEELNTAIDERLERDRLFGLDHR